MQYPGYIIKRGSTNTEAVKFVQSVVGVTADGIFGSGTEAAVKNFQAFMGLTADGLVGSKTWEVLEFVHASSNPTPEPAPAPKPEPPVVGDKGGQIMSMVLVDRNEWDYDEPARAASRSWDDIIGIEVHYTGAPAPKNLTFSEKRQWLLNIERYHEQTKGWSDIFYNIFVFADGEVWLGRNPLVQSQKSLFNWMTVHVPGTVGMHLTDVQKTKIAKMADIVGGSLRDHGSRASTGCAGSSAREFISAYNDGSFRQTLSGMTRGEFAEQMLGSVQAMIDAGITSQSVANYRANDLITRAEAATMFVRYAGESVSSVDEGLQKAVDMGFYTMIGNGSDVFQKVWFDGVFAKVEKHVADVAAAEAARLAAEAEAARLAAEAKAQKAAEEAARLEAERIAEEAAAEAAAEVARLEAEQAAAEEAARLAAEEEARLAAEAAAAAEAERLAAEAAAAEAERLAAEEAARLAAEAAAQEAASTVTESEETEIPDSAEIACCEPIEDAEVGGLLRKILNWIFSIFKK